MDGNGNSSRGYLLFAWSPDGYRLRDRAGEAPEVGTELVDEGHDLLVTKVGPSPLPGDNRRCAYTTGAH